MYIKLTASRYLELTYLMNTRQYGVMAVKLAEYFNWKDTKQGRDYWKTARESLTACVILKDHWVRSFEIEIEEALFENVAPMGTFPDED